MAVASYRPYSKRKGTYVQWYTKEVMGAVSEMTKAEEYEASKRVLASAKKFVPIGKILRLKSPKIGCVVFLGLLKHL